MIIKEDNQNRYQELDALRGFAALFVVFFHCTMGREDYNLLFKYGTTGVDLFFIISGFVIFMSLQKITKGVEFVINRVSRLYPTYWACVTYTFIMMTIFSIQKGTFPVPGLLTRYFGNLTMFQFYLEIADLDPPYWTLIIEMLFYITILGLFQFNLLKYLNAIGISAISIILIATHFFYEVDYVKAVFTWTPLLAFIPLFFAGTVFYKIYTEKTNLLSKYSILVFCLLSQIKLWPYAGSSNGYISWTEYAVMITLYFIIFTLFVNFKLKFIVNKVTLFFGKISFALYLTHQYVSIGLVIPLFYKNLGMNFWVVVFLINLPLITAVATFITYKIEVPYSKKMREQLRKLVN